ncbi:triphosphoribosyl-dephospho-CoA synthase CitG [Spirochaeta isovalerica]|uniref:Probable 2-(5''-triphosphoribosyl)-3'-dephosphocoenzyme-A synthase n=1 Tax=Spirochaeta isovalerica TaxID=150 RepID=A0A841R4X8_9SPIO|nr:triphosphoribosyl-dephospho-CoA synthase CitG [Spirochaeta isovalerica]
MTFNRPEERIASLAVEAMLHEAAAGPKPGLVDRYNNGAHKDMDLFTFCSSAAVLHPYFSSMTETGFHFTGSDLLNLLRQIRPIGIEAEKAMFEATSGINTHKGLIFSLGILCASAGYLLKNETPGKNITGDDLCGIASQMCRGIVERELAVSNRKQTHGEKLFQDSGTTGIRGEAEAGFPSVTGSALPALRRSAGEWNNRLVDILLLLMTEVEDSNVLHRGGTESLKRVKEQAGEALEAGGSGNLKGREILHRMDRDFAERNISPGGCADLLAVTIFLYKLENII